ncbi:polyketide synthase [Collybiopsis luxurians FD-317 M1]|uniref:Pks4 protein n=1 Tax=Collybiopsis luxurians FD-317 M1 TaxID=944289 RepID=A0A0D0C5Q4_9AGAR|nr:polyketide synthase [Collybiopsis luxurians FD-317 M1]
MTTRPAPSYNNPDSQAVAILGTSGGLDTDEFYEFLKQRGSGIITVPSYRWNAEAFHGTVPGKSCTVKGGFIPDFEFADIQEFGITPAEAGQALSTHFTVLHQAFNALQRSGVDYRATNTGVFVGCPGGFTPFDTDVTQAGAYFMTGTSLSITANRVNYVFDLLGPSTIVDTACSSTLTAMHLAVQAIRNGDCDQAVVAGVNLIASPADTIAFSQLGVLSPDGISKSFDSDANGYARADTAGAVVIKRHDLAVRDNDIIHATLVGTALTSCGSLMGSLTTPNPEAQVEAIRRAYADAGLQPHQTDFVELHGTGTVVGDSLEANAAGKVFSDGRQGKEILIGSVKSNVGHAEISAYMTSLAKVVLMLKHKQVLPNGYFETPSKKIEFEKYNLRVPINPEEFITQDPEKGLIASISSFGFGVQLPQDLVDTLFCGSMKSVLYALLKALVPSKAHISLLWRKLTLEILGALTPKSCNTLLQEYKTQYHNVDFPTLCEHLGRRTRQMPYRTYAISDTFESATFPEPTIVGKRPNPIVFCFSGQGPQHWHQGRNLMAAYPVFRDSILACDKAYKAYVGESFTEKTGLFLQEPNSSYLETSMIWPADIITVSITFFQIAMFDFLTSLGVRPTAVVGHSLGETATYYASGAISREMAVKLAVARGRALTIVDNTGGSMVAISGCSPAAVGDYINTASYLAGMEGEENVQLHVAALNSPSDVGVSGPEKLLDVLTDYINRWVNGATARRLRVSTAVHSPFVDPCEEVYRKELSAIFAEHPGDHCPIIPTLSTVTGEFFSEPYTVDHLWKNVRQPVLFSTAVQKIVAHYGDLATFVEMSPHPVLSQYIKSMGAHDSIGTGNRPPSPRQLKAGAKMKTEVHAILDTIGRLLLCGVNSINFPILNGYPSDSLADIKYPFNKKLWPLANAATHPATYQRWLLPATRALNSTRLRVGPHNPEPWMAEHVIDRINLIPASAYIEMGLEFPNVTEVWDCRFENACILDESVPPMTLEVSKEGVEWFIKSSTSLETMRGDLEWTRQNAPPFDTVHAHGKLGYGIPKLSPNSITFVDTNAVTKRCHQANTREELYEQLGTYAQFGPEFMRINRFCMNETEAVAWIRGYVNGLNATDYNFHPAILDAVFQLYRKLNDGSRDRNVFLPHSIKRAFRNDGSLEPLVLPDEFQAYSVLTEWTPRSWTQNAYVLAENGSVLFTIEGLHFSWVSQENPLPSIRYSLQWQPYAMPASQPSCSIILEASPRKEAVKLLANLDELVASYMSTALRSIPEKFTPEDPGRTRYLAYWKEVVESSGPGILVDTRTRAQLEDILQLVHQVGDSHKNLLSSAQTAPKSLPQDNISDQVYANPPFIGPVFDEFVRHFMELVTAAFTSGKHVLRVLEIGARHGHLTKLLGHALVDAALEPGYYVDYFCSDTDILFAQKATVVSPWMTMTPLVFDPTVSIEEQMLEPASFDIIVAFDTLYSYSDLLPSVLVNLKGMLVPGGYLAAVELDGSSLAACAIGTKWTNFIFGSIYGRNMPLEAPQLSDWAAVLDSTGYNNHLSLSANSSRDSVEHIAFIAQASTSKRLTNGFLSHTLSSVEDDNFTIIQHFSAGDEVNLVKFVSTLDSTLPYSIWIHTENTPSNAALLGLSRTLCHEYSLWKIFTVLFDPSWDLSRQKRFIYETLMPLKLAHAEFMVDKSGHMNVPRVIEAPAPSKTTPREFKAVQFDKTQVWLQFPPALRHEDVEVAVSFVSVSPVFPECSEFSGVVTAVAKDVDQELVGKRVFGIVPGHSGSLVICHREKLFVIPDELSLSVAAALVGRLAFISSVVSNALPSKGHCFTILHAGSCPAAAVATYSFLRASGFQVLVTLTDPSDRRTNQDFGHAYTSSDHRSWIEAARKQAPQGVDLVINFDTDSSVSTETMHIMAVNGTLVQIMGDLPSKLRRGQRYISIDWTSMVEEGSLLTSWEDIPPAVRHSLFSSIKIFDLGRLLDAHESAKSAAPNDVTLLSLEDIDPTLPVTKGGIISGTYAFNPRASYVLIGGVGGLGVAIASFMAENGARHIVLTSRSGEKTLDSVNFIREKRMIDYLRCLPDVTVDIAAVDCLDTAKTKRLFESLNHPVAGVFFLPVALHDQLFVNLKSEDDWKRMYDVKVKGLQVLLEAVNPASLDFLVLTSTTSTLSGSAGQANYTAAQVQMERMGAELPNTVSVAVPPILDAGVLARSMGSGNARKAALEKYKFFGASTRQVVQQCFDAILSLDSKPHNPVYIPAMEWKILLEPGLAPERSRALIRHLGVKDTDESFASGASHEGTIRAICAKVLTLDVDEMDETLPLSSYGLDSLTAARLKGVLKAQFSLEVTQLQLLSNYMTVEKLLSMQEEQAAALEAQNSASDGEDASPDAAKSMENEMNQTIVNLNGIKSGSPIFLVHGAGGGVLVMHKIAQKIQVPVYGVQDTAEAPLTGSLRNLAAFYLEQVKKKQPTGPYRLGGFSFGSVVALVMALMLRESGETVEMLVFLDGAPTLYHRPVMRDFVRQTIRDGTMTNNIMRNVKDMATSGALDEAQDITTHFEEHFERKGQEHQWVARFCEAYSAHLLMGIRESAEIARLEQKGQFEGLEWPARRTVLMKAQNGAQRDTHTQGASEAFDLDKWTDEVQVFEFPGTHFGLLNPASGVGEALNSVLS